MIQNICSGGSDGILGGAVEAHWQRTGLPGIGTRSLHKTDRTMSLRLSGFIATTIPAKSLLSTCYTQYHTVTGELWVNLCPLSVHEQPINFMQQYVISLLYLSRRHDCCINFSRYFSSYWHTVDLEACITKSVGTL